MKIEEMQNPGPLLNIEPEKFKRLCRIGARMGSGKAGEEVKGKGCRLWSFHGTMMVEWNDGRTDWYMRTP